jgi:dsRNA-specific ribonuclease
LGRLGFDLDESATLWLRWACVHSSYLYESVPESPMSSGTLDVLAMLGRSWMRLALTDRARAQRGEFVSNKEASAVLAQDHVARASLGEWIINMGAAYFGKGEQGLQSSGRRSSAADAVAMQVLGALTLVTASQAPADALLEAVSFQLAAPEPDWPTLLVSQLRSEPTYARTDSGPDHDKSFTITVQANGRSASATAGSVKAARRAACRAFVLQHLPGAVNRLELGAARRATPPLAYDVRLPEHARARAWALQAFEVANEGLMSQALTHRSWTHENSGAVARARQRDYGTLATEGSEILTTLVRHQYALRTLNATFLTPPSAIISPAVTREAVGDFFDAMPIAGGVLRSSGTALTPDIKEDVAQAIAGAAWRANGDRLAQRQASQLARWIRSFTPPPDPATQLQEYCSRAKVAFRAEFEERGPDHAREYRATIIFNVDGEPRWRGDWRAGKTPAKQTAADGVLDLLLGQADSQPPQQESNGRAILRGLLLAELRAIDPDRVSYQRELAAGRLGVDWLASGAYDEYVRWSEKRSGLIRRQQNAVVLRLNKYYEAVLKQRRREAVRQWIVRNTPAQGTEVSDATGRVGTWWTGHDAGRLALLDDLLAAIEDDDPHDALLDYVEAQAGVIATTAGGSLESERAEDDGGRTLTLRVAGAGLSEALNPVIEVVDAVIGSASWVRESQAVSLTLPTMPTVDSALSRAGFEAVDQALRDPWLRQIQRALASFLSLTERLFESEAEPTAPQVEELSQAELALIQTLRSQNGEGE